MSNVRAMARLTRIASIALILSLCVSFYLITSRPSLSFLPLGREAPRFDKTGHWGPRIPVPLVPVAVAVLPPSGRVLIWAADSPIQFGSRNHTITAVFDPWTSKLVERNVSETKHNMFCPGLSIDLAGRPVVTGGSSSKRTSIFDTDHDVWISGPDMTIGRGYHAQATLQDGRIFAIGGSWSGGEGNKSGELFDPSISRWTSVPGCTTDQILTQDNLGAFASDNHPWLFAWKGRTVFQAGPSRAMNWFDTRGNGNQFPAGIRGRDNDAMNGNAVMYDAGAGKILTLGGAPSYKHAFSTTAAHVITLGEGLKPVLVEELPRSMHRPRAYANAVVLPTGDVFVNGGASYALQWTDVNSTWTPELWRHRQRTFDPMARSPVPRNYHSVAVLLPDATVLTGGGGLCWERCLVEGIKQWTPENDHLDLQVFSPPYLFGPDGTSLAKRSRIERLSASSVKPGSAVDVVTDTEVEEFAIVRYGSATHSINTDQRRIKLEPVLLSCGDGSSVSGMRDLAEAANKSGPATSCTYRLRLPDDGGVAIPGYWMLFAVNLRGVPSIAETIYIEQGAI